VHLVPDFMFIVADRRFAALQYIREQLRTIPRCQSEELMLN